MSPYQNPVKPFFAEPEKPSGWIFIWDDVMLNKSYECLDWLSALSRLDVRSRGGFVTNVEPGKKPSVFQQLAGEILKGCSSASRSAAISRGAPEEIRLLENADYGRPLRRSLARAEVRTLVAEARSVVWPNLNNQSLRLVSPKEYTRLWAGLGVQFQLAKLNGDEGLEMLGFYVRKMGGARLPLICVNTAHHPAAIGAAFSHEMGHHLVGQLFDSRKEHDQLLASTAYGQHLVDPEELAADVLVSLGVFPEKVARQIFITSEQKKTAKPTTNELPNSVSAAVLKHMERRYALRFDGSPHSAKMLQYLPGLIHFAKLRQALLTEYDI
jgi:hypothetical protein